MRNDALGFFWEDMPVVKQAKAPAMKRQPPKRTWEEPGYLPGLAEALAFDVPVFTDDELIDVAWQAKLSGKPHRMVWDIECYPNYFLMAFKSIELGKVVYFELGAGHTFDVRKARWVIENFCQVGFNSIGYDACIMTLAVNGAPNEALFDATEGIILREERPADILRRHKCKKIQFDHIDLIEVAPLRASLKIYGGRVHTKRMQDLPFRPGLVLTLDQIAIVRWYCLNDLASTQDLLGELKEQLDLRYAMSTEYGVDLRSKSDAQIAEAVFAHEIERITGSRCYRPEIPIGTAYRYNVPDYLKFRTPMMNWVLQTVKDTWFIVDETGSIGMPPQLAELKINIANSTYQMGIGGLHSTEKRAMHIAGDDYVLKDVDVESFYPRIILNQQLFPKHLGKVFLQVYDAIVKRRIAAKHAKDEVVSSSLKIVINGSYGKLGSKYSILYAPDLMIQVTISGQLSLLMLIETLELHGVSVVSANTDGVVIKATKGQEALVDMLVKQWEKDTNFKTEETKYSALYSRDVNNYVAVYAKPVEKNGKITYAKTKGAYAKPGLQKNPASYIASEAVVALLAQRIPLYDTIKGCKDIRKFLNVRNVTGGAVKVLGTAYDPNLNKMAKEKAAREAGWYPTSEGKWGRTIRHPETQHVLKEEENELEYAYASTCEATSTQFLGKSIRWYYAKGDQGELIYAKNGNKVPRSDGAQPCMDLPSEFPEDLDHDWYMREAEKILTEIGYASKVTA